MRLRIGEIINADWWARIYEYKSADILQDASLVWFLDPAVDHGGRAVADSSYN